MMSKSGRTLFALGALLGAIAIGLDAWHAHGGKSGLDPEAYEAFGRGIRIQYVAATGLLACGLLAGRTPSRLASLAGAVLALGALLFCSEVYRGALGQQTFGLAPAGGSLSILGWLLLACAGALSGRPKA
jgi:uncharacterized membrane protein YgdD (TMEM256/DUF423 family)